MPVHLASNTGGTWLTTFSIAKSRKPINNLSTGPSLLFFGRKIKAALVGIPALLGMPIFLSRRYAPVFEVEPPPGGPIFLTAFAIDHAWRVAAIQFKFFVIFGSGC